MKKYPGDRYVPGYFYDIIDEDRRRVIGRLFVEMYLLSPIR